ncbi:MAG TPA: YdiU family protein, partial [Burkholderiales bacterium]|nr:YdiU family protein [Burkholderiales bacterium]
YFRRILPSQFVIPHPTTRAGALADLCDVAFESSFVRELPGDPLLHNVSRAVRNACYTRVNPTPVAAPRLLGWSDALGESLGIARPPSAIAPAVEVLAGNRVIDGMAPYAARYGGHQFGVWAGQLGDGRAITLGEVIAPGGGRYDLQLKGAGRTPYSRTADGRAVLRSSVREFMCSEAMHWLGVPTTRALSLVATGDSVIRDMFYDGNPESEPGAIVCRVAPSFVRFGNFEILAAHDEVETLKRLADYVVVYHFPELGTPSPEVYVGWFEEICRRTAVMVAEWTRVGFVHGVMNTDNMSVLGLTIDYGPYGWLEGFDPMWTPNTTDAQGRRYRFGAQPQIAQWNLSRFAGALLPLVDKAALEQALAVYRETFERESARMTAEKLGVTALDRAGDEALLGEMFEALQAVETDMTLFFRLLANVPVDGAADAADEARLIEPLRRAFYSDDALEHSHRERLTGWLRRYIERVRSDAAPAASRVSRMNRANPKYVLRNYLAQLAIDALAAGDATVMERLMHVLQRPYDEQPEHDDLAERRPEWARNRPGCSALSCSS